MASHIFLISPHPHDEYLLFIIHLFLSFINEQLSQEVFPLFLSYLNVHEPSLLFSHIPLVFIGLSISLNL